MSIKSYIPGAETPAEDASIFGDFPGVESGTSNDEQDGRVEPVALSELEEEGLDSDFTNEFDPVGEIEPGEGNAGKLSFYPETHV